MRKIAFVLLSTLALGCAGQKPPPVSLSDNQKTKSPFTNTVEEEIFWSIVKGDVSYNPQESNIDYKIADMIHNALFLNNNESLEWLNEIFETSTWSEPDSKMTEKILTGPQFTPQEKLMSMRDCYHGRQHAQAVLGYVLYHNRLTEIINRAFPPGPDLRDLATDL